MLNGFFGEGETRHIAHWRSVKYVDEFNEEGEAEGETIIRKRERFSHELTLAIVGVVFKSFAVDRFAIASVVVYLGMGWLVVFAMRPLLHALTWHGIFWIGLGGLCYTAGIVFYALDRLSYFHAFWHLFVLAGSACHYFAVLFYDAQPRS